MTVDRDESNIDKKHYLFDLYDTDTEIEISKSCRPTVVLIVALKKLCK